MKQLVHIGLATRIHRSILSSSHHTLFWGKKKYDIYILGQYFMYMHDEFFFFCSSVVQYTDKHSWAIDHQIERNANLKIKKKTERKKEIHQHDALSGNAEKPSIGT